jgi:hypothetical protein
MSHMLCHIQNLNASYYMADHLLDQALPLTVVPLGLTDIS